MTSGEVERLIDEYGRDIYRFCMRLSGSRPDGEDLYQQTFLKALESGLTVKWEENPKALLFALANGLYHNSFRKKMRRERIAPGTDMDDITADKLSSPDDTEGEVITHWEQEILKDAVMNLPEKHRLPILLFYMFDFPVEEISLILAIPAGTVKSRLHKGREYLRKKLEESGYERTIS